MARARNFVTARAITGNGNGEPQRCEGSRVGILIRCTAAGTTWTPQVQWSADGTNFGVSTDTAEAFTAITAVGVAVREFAVKAPFMRISDTAVTGNFTYNVDAYFSGV